ncbi:MAG: alpha/beta fold hydrolase [Candidatus Binatia bacterium]
MRRLFSAVAVLMLLVAALLVTASLSGRQAPIDAVAEAERRHGVDLESRLVEVNGTRLHVVLAGPADGAPVLLLHGYPEFWWGWHEQIARLAQAGYRVIAPDQRGYNGSDKPAAVEAYRIQTLSADVIALLDALDVRQVCLAGHDWGGAIAWRVAIEHPERVRKLVMFNAPHPLAWEDARREPGTEETINWFRTFFQIPWLPEHLMRLDNWGLISTNLAETSRPGTFPEADLDLYRYAWDRDDSMRAMLDWYRAAGRFPQPMEGDGTVRVPVRLMWGMQDRFFDSRLATFSTQHCADATLTTIPDAGHWLLHEEPVVTSQALIDFCAPSAPPS